MRKVGIIGLGHVGATVAFTLFTHGIADELVLIDKNPKKAQAEFNDLSDTLARNDFHVKLKAQDFSDLRDLDVLITAFGNIRASVESGDRFAEFGFNSDAAKEVGQQIKDSGFHGIIINVANPCDAVTTILQKVTGLPQNHVFGTGTFLDTARMQRAVGDHLHQDPRNVSGFVLGEHGNSQFVAWSTVSVNNKPATSLLDEATRAQLMQATKDNAFVVAAGKGYTSYAIATCAVRLAQAVFADAKLFAPVSVFVPSVGTYVGYPAIIGADGVEEVIPLELTAAEDAEFRKSAQIIKEHVDQLF